MPAPLNPHLPTPGTVISSAIASGTGHPAYSQTLPCEPESARRARLLVRTACDTWHLPELADAESLVISELVSNAERSSTRSPTAGARTRSAGASGSGRSCARLPRSDLPARPQLLSLSVAFSPRFATPTLRLHLRHRGDAAGHRPASGRPVP